MLSKSRSRHHNRQPLELRVALRAIRTLLDNPDDTAQAFVIVRALSGGSICRNYRRFCQTELGKNVFREQRSLLTALQDRAALAALPAGSVGRAYLQFLKDEKITAEGLVGASVEGGRTEFSDPDLNLFQDRMRDMHDLWHVLTGYKGDVVGEAALLAFTFPQTWNPGIGFIAAAVWLKAKRVRSDVTGFMLHAFGRGLFARWLPGEDWESILALPLDEVREKLRIGGPPVYETLRSNVWMAAPPAS
jgi:ubiquinone biosynthesis protein COQ4